MRSGNMPRSLYQNWQFAIEVNGFDVALFHKGQEPKTEFEEVAFAPGGSMFDQKVAGLSRHLPQSTFFSHHRPLGSNHLSTPEPSFKRVSLNKKELRL